MAAHRPEIVTGRAAPVERDEAHQQGKRCLTRPSGAKLRSAVGLTNVVPIAPLGGRAARATARSRCAATLLYEPSRTTTRQPCCSAAMPCYAGLHGGRRGGDPSMACKESEAHPLGRQQSASNRTSRSLASHVIALGPRLSTCGVVMWRPATPGSRCGGRSLHTAEVTGPIPVTPTSENASRSRSNGPFARRFARRWAWPCSSWRSASLHPSRWQATRLLCAVNSGSANSASSATHGLPICCGSARG